MSKKLSQAALTDAVQTELITYLQNGTINEQSVARTLDITDLQIEDIDRLKRIHFCLDEDVINFVDSLQERLRRIKTANQRQREYTRGEVRGGIDWQATTRHRYTKAAGDRTQFACKTPYTEYDIPENLVLKKLLWLIHSTVQDDISEINYDWARDVWTENRIATFDRIYSRNVHLNRIRDGDDITVTRRTLNTARSARQSLYTETYTHFDRYRRLLRGEYADADITELLMRTLVVPERLPRLFELFCVFRLLRTLDTRVLTLQPIEPDANEIATLENDKYTVNVYHDQTGGLSFYVPLPASEDIDSENLKRYQRASERHGELVETFLGNNARQALFSGRPDMVLEIYNNEDQAIPTEVVLGEIKYSNREQTFARGLKQLTKYMEFAQKDGFLNDNSVDVSGLLITDGVETEVSSSPDGDVIHYTAEDLLYDMPNSWVPTRLTSPSG